MNEANIERLLQVTTLRRWGSLSAATDRDNRPEFDDHLAQAASPPPMAEMRRPTGVPLPDQGPGRTSLPRQKPGGDRDARSNVDDAGTFSETKCDERETDDATHLPRGEMTSDAAKAAGDLSDQVEEQPDDAELVEREKAHDEGEKAAIQRTAATEAPLATVAVEPAASAESGSTGSLASGITRGPESVSAEAPVAGGEQLPSDSPHEWKPPAQHTNSSTPLATVSSFDTDHDLPDLAVETTSNTAPGSKEIKPTDGESLDTLATPSSRSKRAIGSPKQQRPTESSSANARRYPTSEAETQSSGAVQDDEKPAKTSEAASDEPREATIPRSAAGRSAPRVDAPAGANGVPSAVGISSVAADAANEPTKSEQTDDSARPAGPHHPRNDRHDALPHSLAKLQRNGPQAIRGQRDAKGEEVPNVDATRFVSRVAKAFHTAQERGGTLQLRLSPPELGALRLELLVQDGVLAAKLEAETPAARRVLLDHLPVLRDRLAEQNIRIERFDVDVRQEGGSSQPNPQHAQQQRPQHSSPHRPAIRSSTPAAKTADATAPLAHTISNSQINLVA